MGGENGSFGVWGVCEWATIVWTGEWEWGYEERWMSGVGGVVLGQWTWCIVGGLV